MDWLKYSFIFLIPDAGVNIDESVKIIKKRGIFMAELYTYKYFGGIYFNIKAEGNSETQCIKDLVNKIVNHSAFEPLWRLKDGMSRYEVCVAEDDPQVMKVIKTSFRVWAMDEKEAEKKIKKFNHFYEIESVKQL